ncbi:hypothetical protein EG68_10806 [Paragonimus skrjabini miyazakii]|uniref:Uncharacterized protein n=1 Tax=Paragonimus skrjabini miyazakii TaxID=59628 RepID=A0A8S9YPQ8_9TREM|nr:hypothetical protein EG68_10806 [Paragonimus skrjabini miyazakii]
METDERIKSKFPLHYYVWHNNYSALDELLQQKKHDVETLDPHGRTPLMLAVVLDHLEAARVLLRHGANASFVSKSFWSVAQEAISTGDPQLVKLVLVHRDAQIVRHQGLIMTDLLRKLRETPDFYIEMKWEFTSWLPLVSRMCPSDVCRVWKSGPNVRIDTNLIGFNGSASWIRGHLSYIFRVNGGSLLTWWNLFHHSHIAFVINEEALISTIPSIAIFRCPSFFHFRTSNAYNTVDSFLKPKSHFLTYIL